MRITGMLGTIEQAAERALHLAANLEEGELLSTGTTRAEVTRLLTVLASALRTLPADAVQTMPELDWAGWRGMASSLALSGTAHDDALWFGVHSLLPDTLHCLQQHRQAHPELFEGV